jgi:hypothetical protein
MKIRTAAAARFYGKTKQGEYMPELDALAVCRKWRFRLRLNSLEMAPE